MARYKHYDYRQTKMIAVSYTNSGPAPMMATMESNVRRKGPTRRFSRRSVANISSLAPLAFPVEQAPAREARRQPKSDALGGSARTGGYVSSMQRDHPQDLVLGDVFQCSSQSSRIAAVLPLHLEHQIELHHIVRGQIHHVVYVVRSYFRFDQ